MVTQPPQNPASSAPPPEGGDGEVSERAGLETPILSRRAPGRRWVAAAAVAAYLILVLMFVHGARKQARLVNTDPHRTDQSAYLNFAEDVVESGWVFGGYRNRMPAYPYLIATVYDSDDSLRAFFRKAKMFNIALTVVLLHLIGWITWRDLGPLAGVTTILIAGFTLFIYRAPFVQAEVLFYALLFLAIASSYHLLRRPGIGIAALTGFLFALAQLTKASALPALVVLTICLAMGALRDFFTESPHERKTWSGWPVKGAGSALVAVAIFLLVLSPYLINSKRTYDRFFYNVNSTFYMWYDSWEEAKAGTRAHGDRVGWPEMKPGSIPSARKYIRNHSPGEIVERLSHGASEIHDRVWGRYGFLKYTLLFGLAVLLAFIVDRLKEPWPPFRIFRVAAFAATTILGYVLLSYWVYVLGPGIRVFMGIALPAIYFFQLALKRSPSATSTFELMGRKTSFRELLNLLVLFCILSEIYPVLTQRVGVVYGGY